MADSECDECPEGSGPQLVVNRIARGKTSRKKQEKEITDPAECGHHRNRRRGKG